MTDRRPPDIARLKRMTLAPALLAPVLGGAILYYSLKDTAANDVAKYANIMSFVGFALWTVAWIAIASTDTSLTVQETFRWGGTGVMVVGIVMAAFTSARIKNAVSADDDE